MTTSDVTPTGEAPEPQPAGELVPRQGAPVVPTATGRPATAATSPPERGGREAPPRPSLEDKPGAPVLVKLPPPIPVRLAQTLWILSLITGACAIVYLFIIRTAQLPDIADLIRSVDDTRAEGTYDIAADIVFWSVFAVIIALMLLQLTFVVSFSNRRPHMRWWLLGTLVMQLIVLLVARELVAMGDRGQPVTVLLLGQVALGAMALLLSVLPPALRWTTRQKDVRRGPEPAGL